MTGGNSVVGLWRDRETAPERAEEAVVVPVETSVAEPTYSGDEEPAPRGRWRRPIATIAFVVLTLAWLGALAFSRFGAAGGRALTLEDGIAFVSTASAPLALIAVAWLLLLRTSRGEESRYARTVAALRTESQRLEALLDHVSYRLDSNRSALSEQSDKLMTIGEDAAVRMSSMSEVMRTEIETIDRHAQGLKSSAAAARGDMAVLLATLPKAQVQTRQMLAALDEAGMVALEKAGALDAQLSLLGKRGSEANEIAGNAAQRLASHLARMEGVSEVAGARLEQAADQMTGAVDQALERAGAALEAARQGMEAQGAAMMAMVEQNQAALANAGAESAESISRRVIEIRNEINHIAKSFADQDEASQRLVKRMHADLGAIEDRFGEFDASGIARTERLSTAVAALRDHADDLTNALQGGGDTANSLVDRVGSLMTALDAATREIDETLPAAFTRLEEKTKASLATVTAATPVIETLSNAAVDALGKLSEADVMLARQRDALAELTGLSAVQMNETKAAADALAESIANTTASAQALASGAGPQLVDAMVRVRETASQATQHVRNAFSEIIQQSSKSLGDQAQKAMTDALTSQVEAQMASVASITETAVATAQKATDRLMRQMLTISETSAALEERIAEAKAEVEHSDQANFARRVALLIESLNSTAIDVTKIFSNDVTDVAWASYLRGDRGIFTRRAVRLLDSSQAREIARNYENDPEFREQVNRYIHDFEAMLRNVLATRDGSPLGVTLLSSDNGKLYVALAQAIERLRN
ncbi:MAG: hypothetical protein ACKVOJ_05645 [Sphingomonadaceae bacterium]